MDGKYEFITPETPLWEACRILGFRSKEQSGIPGLVVQRASGEYLDIFVRPNQKMIELFQVFEEQDVDFIPVADGEKIVGVVRNTAILTEIAPRPTHSAY
jgi:predicted transcriptional regulator